jgi:hypothetical protein
MTTRMALAMLINEGYFQVAEKGGEIHLYKIVSGKTIHLVLQKINDEFVLSRPQYNYKCTTSYLDFTEEEERTTRQYKVAIAIVEHLQKAGVWNSISNKGYLKINTNNPKVKNDRAKMLTSVVTGLIGKSNVCV